jgi:hypothetical protein
VQFGLGIVGFSLVMHFIPEPDFEEDKDDASSSHGHSHGSVRAHTFSVAVA